MNKVHIMKKTSVIVTIVLITLFAIGCKGKKAEEINKPIDLEGKIIGMVTPLASTNLVKEDMSKYVGSEQLEILYFNRQADVSTALVSGKIDGAPVLEIVADYYIKRNNGMKVISMNSTVMCDVVMLLRREDETLKYKLDSAFAILQENGTMEKLKDEWITNLPAMDEPSNNYIPKIEGAKTVFIGICGDVTPLDYIAADGRPAGYNVALLTEIGKLLNINFEFVTIDSQAKLTALEARKIDVVFCQVNVQENAVYDVGNEYISTTPYFTDGGMCFLVRK